MGVAYPFIKRPVGTTLLALALTLAGILGFCLLPVSPLPQVEFPTIMVSANLPGADPETMAATVAAPLERQLGRIAGVNEITSSSYRGTTYVTLQFALGRDIDGAARDVQAAINAARRDLPANLPANPSYRKVNPSEAPILILALTAEHLARERLYDLAASVLQPRLSQVPGVGQVSVNGGALPAVRVQLNPKALAGYHLSLEDVRAMLASTNSNLPKGQISDPRQAWEIEVNDQLWRAAEYLPLILAFRSGAAIKLEDVAGVSDSTEDLRTTGLVNGRPAVLLVINRQPRANILDTVAAIRRLLPQLEASLPADTSLSVILDRSPPIRQSLGEVGLTLALSCGLVILVVFLVLGSPRATLIPGLAVVVSLVGTGAFMFLAGHSLDNLSLMALTVATGLVVDDAIVVLENITRGLEGGLPPGEAAARGARQILFTVLSMSLSLVAAFIPILFMGGILGRLVQEFALVLSAAITLSMLVSLTLTPMMCARLLKAGPGQAKGIIHGGGSRAFAWALGLYQRSLAWTLDRPRLMLTLTILAAGLATHLYVVIPKGFFPQQDSGRILGNIQAAQDISFQAMERKLKAVVAIIKADPDVDQVSGFTGSGITATNAARMFISLKPLGQRAASAQEIVARLRPRLAREPGAPTFLQVVQDLHIGGRSANAMYQYTLQGDNIGQLNQWSARVLGGFKRLPQMEDVSSDLRDKGLRTLLNIDRQSAARLGISVQAMDDALGDAFSQRQVAIIYGARNQYRVIMELDPRHTQYPQALGDLYLPTNQGGQAPLNILASQETTPALLNVNHQGQSPAVTISFNLASGFSLGQAVEAIAETMDRLAPPASIRGRLHGTAQAFQDTLGTQPILIMTALAAVYIVLGILYESYVHPLTIISTLPSAGLGALLTMMAWGQELNVMGVIGIVLLVGVVQKNGILLVDFALAAQRRQHLSPQAAIHQACLARFRPIMMTTMAAMLGALPLALGQGAGGELRRPLGLTIIGGLVFSQAFTLYTTPVIYLYMDRFRQWKQRKKGRQG
jgi:multidrug efflux pump